MTLLTSAIAAGTIGLVVPALATPGNAATRTGTAAPPEAGTGSVMLVTGDRVDVTTRPAGPPSFTLRPVTSRAGESYRDAAGDTYVVPGLAAPYLGRQLDPSLFDVSALVRDGLAGHGEPAPGQEGLAGSGERVPTGSGESVRVPVGLTFTGAAVAPPGVTLTSVSGHSARGYLTAGSAGEFGRALRAVIAGDVTAGRPAGSTAPGLARMWLDAGGAPVVVEPFAPAQALLIRARGAVGTFPVLLAATDPGRRLVELVPVVDGTARVEVPAGYYTARAAVPDFDGRGDQTGTRVATADVTVPAPTGVATATLDLRGR